MVALANPEKPAKRHHRIGDLAGIFVDHQVMHRAQRFASAIVDEIC